MVTGLRNEIWVKLCKSKAGTRFTDMLHSATPLVSAANLIVRASFSRTFITLSASRETPFPLLTSNHRREESKCDRTVRI